MKFLVLLLLAALAASAPSPAEREKRSPDDIYYYVPPGRRTIFPRTRGIYRTSAYRTSGFRSFGGYPRGGYFIELDDLYDDRRKRQAVHSTTRQKRAADFDFDFDDDYYFYRRNPLSAISYSAGASPRTRTASTSFYTPRRFIYYDFDDRRKRQATHPNSRQKRSADFDEDDFYYTFASSPVYTTTYSAPVVQSRTSFTPTVYRASSPVTYYYDFDDK